MDRNALAELLQALESRRDAEERRREERYTALIERRTQRIEPTSMESGLYFEKGTNRNAAFLYKGRAYLKTTDVLQHRA
ncbi:UNVERIFIED_CONTAM: hypothetical protein FKN15_078405 [Acipenser sinensis]